jgi:hypothetical protein
MSRDCDEVQDRYVGDLGDYLKLGLLRWLTTGTSAPRVGVVWYRTVDEAHNADGKHIAPRRQAGSSVGMAMVSSASVRVTFRLLVAGVAAMAAGDLRVMRRNPRSLRIGDRPHATRSRIVRRWTYTYGPRWMPRPSDLRRRTNASTRTPCPVRGVGRPRSGCHVRSREPGCGEPGSSEPDARYATSLPASDRPPAVSHHHNHHHGGHDHHATDHDDAGHDDAGHDDAGHNDAGHNRTGHNRTGHNRTWHTRSRYVRFHARGRRSASGVSSRA